MPTHDSSGRILPGNTPLTSIEPVNVNVQPDHDSGGVLIEVVDRDGHGFVNGAGPAGRARRRRAHRQRDSRPARLAGRSDQGCVILVVPFGAQRSRRIIVPHAVAVFLRDELIAAVGAPKTRRPRNRRAFTALRRRSGS